jgi:hypothetical protein
MAKKSKKQMTQKDAERIEIAEKKANGGEIPNDSFAKRARAAALRNDK